MQNCLALLRSGRHNLPFQKQESEARRTGTLRNAQRPTEPPGRAAATEEALQVVARPGCSGHKGSVPQFHFKEQALPVLEREGQASTVVA